MIGINESYREKPGLTEPTAERAWVIMPPWKGLVELNAKMGLNGCENLLIMKCSFCFCIKVDQNGGKPLNNHGAVHRERDQH